MLDESSFETQTGNKLNNIIAVIGNNASGKTNILKGLSFLLWFAHNSYFKMSVDDNIPVEPHKLCLNEDISFELLFENNGKEYQYKLSVNKQSISYEYLGVKNIRGFSVIYEIKKEKDDIVFLKWNLGGKLTDDDKERFVKRKNSSLFSFLLNTGHLPAMAINNIIKNGSNVYMLGRRESNVYERYQWLSGVFANNPQRKEKILKFIKDMDFGVSDFDFTPDGDGKKTLIIKHKNEKKEFFLSFLEESNGTQNAIDLLNSVISAIESGGIFICDELESSIHTYIAKKIVSLFANKNTNPKNAQILFSTHQPWLLDDRTKTQIYLVEKDENFETEVYRLDEVEGVRNDDNYCAKYLSGAYGAVSKMRWF
jgi:AAA15 family ATPase/GTPase